MASIPQDKDLLPKLNELFQISMGFLQNSVDSKHCLVIRRLCLREWRTFMAVLCPIVSKDTCANAQWQACCHSEFISFTFRIFCNQFSMHQFRCVALVRLR
jgi:hypothetical protein